MAKHNSTAYGECPKHKGQSMLNCSECSIENFDFMKNIKFKGDWKKLDMTKVFEEEKKRKEKEKKRLEKENKIEEKRITDIKCPCCKSTKKQPVNISVRNGPLVVGGHNSINKLASYIVCQDCGVMYVDLHKKGV